MRLDFGYLNGRYKFVHVAEIQHFKFDTTGRIDSTIWKRISTKFRQSPEICWQKG